MPTIQMLNERPAVLAEMVRIRLMFQALRVATEEASAEMERITRYLDVPAPGEPTRAVAEPYVV